MTCDCAKLREELAEARRHIASHDEEEGQRCGYKALIDAKAELLKEKIERGHIARELMVRIHQHDFQCQRAEKAEAELTALRRVREAEDRVIEACRKSRKCYCHLYFYKCVHGDELVCFYGEYCGNMPFKHQKNCTDKEVIEALDALAEAKKEVKP